MLISVLSDNTLVISGGGAGTYNIRIRGCACHIFGSEIQLVSQIFGYKILCKNFPYCWIKLFSSLANVH